MANENTAKAANGERVSFTVRYDNDFVDEVDKKRADLGTVLGFDVSRQDYFAHACRQLWKLEAGEPA